jgi:hypothetical protein
MGATKLDGAGAQKMKTLEEALLTVQSMHGMTERMAMDMKNQKSVGMIPQQVKRLAVPLQGQLKGQFGLIADQVSGMILAVGRGGSDVVRLRTMREHRPAPDDDRIECEQSQSPALGGDRNFGRLTHP